MYLLTPQHARRAAATTLSALVLTFGIALGAVAASTSQDALDWARAALERNGALEVVATDRATGLITVRVKRTGELRRVRADEVVAVLSPGATEASPALGPSDSSARTPGEPAGHVLLSGPGYRIATAGPTGAGPGEAAAAQPASASPPPPNAGGALLTSLPLERRHDPIICQGARLLHIDSRNLQFDGDAVSAENGCEVHITNSRIVAKGIGISARSASVHIDNSSIEGGEGSIEASDGAQVYARSSTFSGLIRHLDTAAFHDMGGNVGN
jgi:hypothetical protein